MKLFVGNMPPGASEKKLREIFEAFGPIGECTILEDRGYGFVHFVSSEDAREAVDKLDGSEFEGAKITVQISHSRPGRGRFFSERRSRSPRRDGRRDPMGFERDGDFQQGRRYERPRGGHDHLSYDRRSGDTRRHQGGGFSGRGRQRFDQYGDRSFSRFDQYGGYSDKNYSRSDQYGGYSDRNYSRSDQYGGYTDRSRLQSDSYSDYGNRDQRSSEQFSGYSGRGRDRMRSDQFSGRGTQRSDNYSGYNGRFQDKSDRSHYDTGGDSWDSFIETKFRSRSPQRDYVSSREKERGGYYSNGRQDDSHQTDYGRGDSRRRDSYSNFRK